MKTDELICYPSHFVSINEAASEMRLRSPEFVDGALAQIVLGSITLPEFIALRLVVLVGPRNQAGGVCCVGMASSDAFTARRAISPEIQHYRIDRLDGAEVDEQGNVTLVDETRLYRVKLIPTEFHPAWNIREATIVRFAMGILGPEPEYVDYANLPELENIPLKVLRIKLRRGDWKKKPGRLMSIPIT